MRRLNFAKTFLKPLLFSTLAGYGVYQYTQYNPKTVFALSRGELPTGNLPDYFEKVDVEKVQAQFENLTIIRSKAVDSLLGRLRDVNVSREQFRFLAKRIIRFIVEEALANECDQEVVKQSPLGQYKTPFNPREDREYVAVSIMRSGNGMVEEVMNVLPEIYIGKILLQRDETTQDKKPIFFFEKLPKNMDNKRIFVLDPMLATGGSIIATIAVLKEKGVKEENIVLLNLICCEEGLKNVFTKFPKVKIITAKVDPILLPNKYIAPGIGDFGDRFYGTEH